MQSFFRFPSTPHLAWLGRLAVPREDKVLGRQDATILLSGEVVVEEKLDGANIGLSLAEDGSLQVQNRGQYLIAPFVGQFVHLPEWLSQHGEAIRDCLDGSLIIFGEWCAAQHSISYDRLPDWFVMFDVYDRATARFWSTDRRNALASGANLATVPTLLRGKTNLAQLKEILDGRLSRYALEPMEGLVVRRESPQWCETRAKLVRPDFTQEIWEHWSRRSIRWNRVDWSARSDPNSAT